MITTVTKIGDSLGVIFDSAFMDLARLKVGDQLNVEMHEDGTITLTPMDPRPAREEVSAVIQETMRDYAATMKKLA